MRLLIDVLAWEALPRFLLGMRQGVSLALVIAVVAEMHIGSAAGIGQRAIAARTARPSSRRGG